MVELRPTDLVAHESYPAPFDTMICAFCSLATSDVFGSKSCASTFVELRMEVTFTSVPPICSAREPHWLMDATTVIGPVGSFAEGCSDCEPPQALDAISMPVARMAAMPVTRRCG